MSLLSNGRSGSSAFRLSTIQCRCRLRARASLRNRHQGPSSMGFEDEVEQSFGRPCRQTNGRSKRTNQLTSSIVPRGTSFHRAVEPKCSPIALVRWGSHTATASSRVQRNSVPSTHMRCMITAMTKLRGDHATAIAPNDCWSMDWMYDQLFDGRRLWVLTCSTTSSKCAPRFGLGIRLKHPT